MAISLGFSNSARSRNWLGGVFKGVDVGVAGGLWSLVGQISLGVLLKGLYGVLVAALDRKTG